MRKSEINLLVISQNVFSYDLSLPKDAILRINLAWCNSLDYLKSVLDTHKEFVFFIDLPVSRIKPPNNKYSLEDLIPIIESHKQIRYFAVSNVESKNDLQPFLEKLPDYINIVPKIESPKAVLNIKEICDSLKTEKKIVMLDHDDLFSSIIHSNEDKNSFQECIKMLIDFCEENDISLLRTVGVIFSDDERRVTQYEK
jgi:citrate lyase beta subunit